jgi:hypothetical protein
VYAPGEHTFPCKDCAMLCIQQAIITRDNQPSAISTGHRVSIVQEEVHLEHALDLVKLHLHVGTPTPPHRWWRRCAWMPERTAGDRGEGTRPRRPWVTTTDLADVNQGDVGVSCMRVMVLGREKGQVSGMCRWREAGLLVLCSLSGPH